MCMGNSFKTQKKIKTRKHLNGWGKGDLNKETEGRLLAAEDQVLRTTAIKRQIDKDNIKAACRSCVERDQTVAHIVSEYKNKKSI